MCILTNFIDLSPWPSPFMRLSRLRYLFFITTLVKNRAKNIQDLASFSGRFQDLHCKKNIFNS